MQTEASPQTYDWYYRFAAYLATVLIALAVIALVYYASDVVLLVFASVLWGVVLTHLSRWIVRHTGIPYLAVLIAILLILIAALVGGVYYLQHWATQQTETLVSGLQTAYDQIKQRVQSSPLWSSVQPLMANGDAGSRLVDAVRRFLTGTLGFLGNAAFVFVVGFFFAADPRLYRDGVARFVTRSRRAAVIKYLDESGDALISWLLGQLFAMTVIAVLTSTALYFLNVPAAILLGLLAGAISFVPNVGAIVAIVPAALLALQQGPSTALAVIGIYTAIQALESNLLTPLVQQHQIDLPPAILTSAQLFAGLVFGILAVALAAPIMAVVIVLLKHWYFPICDRDESAIADMVKPDGEIRPDSGPAVNT